MYQDIQGEVLNHLIIWKREQQLAGNGHQLDMNLLEILQVESTTYKASLFAEQTTPHKGCKNLLLYFYVGTYMCKVLIVIKLINGDRGLMLGADVGGLRPSLLQFISLS